MPDYCGARWKTQVSAGNTEFWDINGYEKMAAIFLFFSIFIVRIWFFAASRKKDIEIDEDVCTPNDYTVKIAGLPRDITQKQVIEIFERYEGPNGNKVKVEKINFAYFIGKKIQKFF